MGTISDKLMRIINTKEDIRQALISKGYDVPTSIPFKEYAKMILDLPCNADSFPDIEGIVARYSASGLTNEQMAANPVWVDKTGNGRDLQLKNFSWKRMSGVGGYVQDFNDFRNNATVDKIRIDEQGSNSIKVTILTTGIGNAIYIPKNIYQFNKSYFIKISSEGYDEGDMALSFYAPSISTATTVTVSLNPNGITEIPAIKEDDFLAVYINVSGKVGSFTVEQLPLYPGALVFDGVDDYGTCNNFPILTKEKGYTVVALRQWIEEKNDSTALVSNCEKWGKNGAFLFEYNNLRINFLNVAISFGHVSSVDRGKSPFSYQTSKLYNGKNIEPGSFIGSNELVVGKGNKDFSTVSKVAIWELIILDHDATEEELTKIKDYFVKTYPWLFPDQAWTVTGKTNEDEDRATIANITGNGNDLVLSNFGFAEGSGYGLYQQNYSIWNKVSNRATFTVTSSKIHVTSVTAEEYADFIYTTGQQLKQKIRITGLPEGVSFVIGRSGVNLKVISQDGIYNIDILDDSSENPIIGYRINKIIDSCDITIEQIPEYEGYLVTDGVDDTIASSAFKMGKDFTIVGDWKFINNKKSGTGLVKGSSFYIYNTMTGLDLYINSGSVKNSLDGIKSINAACSDGRAYDRNWNEILANTGNVVGSGGALEVSSSGGRFDRIAFKNLAIYPRILSKDDCIKAYNYLQTIKSK
jgi:hypothetical protein